MKLMRETEYTPELLAKIAQCAKTLMTPSMVSFRLGIDEVQLLDLMRAGSPAALADCQQRMERCLNEITV